MSGCVSDSSEEVIRPTKRRRFIAVSSDSSDSDQSASDFVWEEKNDKPKVHKFKSVSGVNKNIINFTRENVYELFMTKEILENIVTETNRFGEKDPSFKEISVEELQVYFALIILMSMVQKPTLQSYWSTDKSIETPYFKTVMSRIRFMAISRNLHFANNERLQRDDPLRKIRPIMDMIKKRFKEVFTPSRDVSLDESLMKCRSRIHYIQYNKSKRARFGIKYYKLCDSRTKYIHNFRVYVGKDKCKKGLASTKIVLDMMKESYLLEKGHCLYIDNWYSSPDLYNKLYKLKTNVCGTVRSNRKHMPKALESKKFW